MTGSDLNSSSKCWEDQEKTTTIIYEEFYEQVLIFIKKESCPASLWFFMLNITPLHRLLVEAVAMTGADLSATSKPWNLQMRTVTTLYEEFYDQGDREMESGRVPVPVMNRTYIDQQALHQVTPVLLDGTCFNVAFMLALHEVSWVAGFSLFWCIFQGDVEKGLGWKPIPLFDRDHAAEVASMQVNVFV